MTSADYEALVSALTDANVALTDQNNEFRSTYDIMADIAAEWDNLSSMEQAALAETLSGTRQQSIFYSIVEQFQEASGAMDAMADSTGTLQSSYDEYMQTVQASITSFKTAFQNLGVDFFQSDFLKFFINLGTRLINIIDKVIELVNQLGGLRTILIAISGVLVTINMEKIYSQLNNLAERISNMGTLIKNMFTSGGAGVTGIALGAGITSTLSAATAGLTLVATAVSAAVSYFKKKQEEANEVALEGAQDFAELHTSLDDYKVRIDELQTSLRSDSLSTEEAYEARKELYSIQNDLIENYGLESGAIDLVTSSYEDATNAINSLVAAEAERTYFENKNVYDNAVNQIERNREYTIQLAVGFREDEVTDAINEFVKMNDTASFEKLFSDYNLKLEGNVTEINAALDELYTALGSYVDSGFEGTQKILEQVSDAYNETNEILDDYGEEYDFYISYKLVTDTKASDIYENITDYTNQLQEAIANQDYEEVQVIVGDLMELDLSGVDSDVVADYLQGLIEDQIQIAEGVNYEARIKIEADFESGNETRENFLNWVESLVDDEGFIDMSLINSLSMDNYGGIVDEEQVLAYQHIALVAENYGVSVSDLISILADYDVVQLETIDIMEDSEDAAEALSDAYDTLTTVIGYLNSAEEEMASDGLTGSTALSIMEELEESGELISEYFSIENDGLTLNTQKYREYINAKQEAMLLDLRTQQSDYRSQMAEMRASGVSADSEEYQAAAQGLAETTTKLNLYSTAIQEAYEDTSNFSDALEDAYGGVTSSANLLNTALEEIDSDGLTSDTALDIIDDLEESGELISDYFSIEEDGLTLNTQKYREYIEVKKEAALQDLNTQRAELEAQMEQMREQGLEDTNKFRETQQTWQEIVTYLDIYTAAMDEATSATTDYFSKYEDATERISNLNSFTAEMSTGGVTREDALDWIQDYEQLAACYDVATNSFIGWEEAVQSIVVDEVNGYIEYLNELLEENAELTDQDRVAIEASIEVLEEYANEVLGSSDALTTVNKGTDQTTSRLGKLKRQVSNVWNSKEFSDARSDLTSLAKESGLTAQDILDLASDNELLATLLDQSGVSALYLASIFEQLSTSGTGALDNITEDAIRLTDVLSEMDAPLQSATDAYNKYQEALGSWEYNDAFNNYQAAYESLGEMFEAETPEFGADFYRTVEYLFGEGYGSWDPTDIYNKLYKPLGDIFSEADSGLGFIQKLYDVQDSLGGDWVKLDSNGNYIWDISAADFAGIAEGLGMTEEEVAACVEALGMFGDFSEYDVNRLIDTFADLDMALQDTEGNAILSEQAVRSLLESFGYEGWQIDQIIAQLEEASNITLFDFSDTSASNIDYILTTLQELGELDLDGTTIGLTSFRDALREMGMTDEQIADFITVLADNVEELGYQFVDASGNTITFEEAIESLGQTDLENLADEADKVLKKFSQIRDYDFDINLSVDSIEDVEDNIDTVLKMIDAYRNEDGTFKVDMEGYEELEELLHILFLEKAELSKPAILTVDTSSASEGVQEISDIIDEWWSAYAEYEYQIAIGGDTADIEATLAEIIGKIMNSDPEVLAQLGWDEGQVDSAMQYLAGNTDLEITAELNEASYDIINDAIQDMPLDELELDINADKTLEALQEGNEYLSIMTESVSKLSEGEIDITINGDESVEEIETQIDNIGKKYSDNPIQITLSADESLGEIEKDIEALAEVTSGENAIKVNLDASEGISAIETAITSLETSLNGIQETASITVTGTAMEDLNTINDFVVEDKPFDVIAQTDTAMKKLNEIINTSIADKTFSIRVNDYATQVIQKIKDQLATLKDKTINVTTNYTSTGTKSDATGTANSKGTADADGTAKASGNDWQTKKAETALVGEIAPEIIVDTKRGIWYTVGDNGPEFAEIPKGAIVFNAAQTEALLKYGQTFSRGTALASGTAYPSGTVTPNNPITGNAYTSSYKKASSSSSSSSSSSLSDSVEEAEEFLELMDWIEIMIDRIERDINHLDVTASSSFFTMTKRASAMEDEMALIADEIELQNAAYEAYIEAANMVELSDEYKELVRSGALLIEEIEDEDLYDAIQDFQEL